MSSAAISSSRRAAPCTARTEAVELGVQVGVHDVAEVLLEELAETVAHALGVAAAEAEAIALDCGDVRINGQKLRCGRLGAGLETVPRVRAKLAGRADRSGLPGHESSRSEWHSRKGES